MTDYSLWGVWHYEFWHIGIAMIIVAFGFLALILTYIFVPDVTRRKKT